MHAHEHVIGAVELEDGQGLTHDLLVHLVGEVLLQGAAVDRPLAGARNNPDAGDGLLAATGTGPRSRSGGLARSLGTRRGGRGLRGVLGDRRVVGVSAEVDVGFVGRLAHYWATWLISKGLGCWAAWGCSVPR